MAMSIESRQREGDVQAAAPPAHPASFRDPSGFLYHQPDGGLLRQVNHCYEADYRLLQDSGLYRDLTQHGLLIEHDEVSLDLRATDVAFRILRPQLVPFISYPYEWSFSALQSAALLTLDIQRRALAAGMTLKDASAYNVQFIGPEPIFIDTSSFERYEKGDPWVAYGQFCQHFLAPLALMSLRDIRLHRLSSLYMDGIPLDLAAALLPWKSRFRGGLLLHLFLHAKVVQKYAGIDTAVDQQHEKKTGRKMSAYGLEGLLDSLHKTISRLTWSPRGTEWSEYYDDNSYTDDAFQAKQRFVVDNLDRARPQTVWDLGANTGVFSRLASQRGVATYAFDLDPACVERNFLECRRKQDSNLLPLCLDLSNPSPAIGWAHQERSSLLQRAPCDLVLALALIHHLAISNNVPLPQLAIFLRSICRWLIIEFVPKSDLQVQRLLQSREDIFDDYHRAAFESAMQRHFSVLAAQDVGSSGRVLYLMKSNDP